MLIIFSLINLSQVFIMVTNKEIPSIHHWNSIILETEDRNLYYNSRQEILGDLCYVYAKNEKRRSLSIGSFYHWMIPAIFSEQVKLLQGEFERCATGYVFWAWVSNKTLEDYLANPNFVPHPSQWNEGANLIIYDFCFPSEKKKFIKKFLMTRKSLKQAGVKNIYYREPGTKNKMYVW